MTRLIPKITIFLVVSLIQACTSSEPDQQVSPSKTATKSIPIERLFLQQVTANSAIIKWRGDASEVCLVISDKIQCKAGKITEGNHKEVQFTGLSPDTLYRYRLDKIADSDMKFRTAPLTGSLPEDGNIHIWVIGDSGTASEIEKDGLNHHTGEAKAVRDGFLKYNAKLAFNERPDFILMLGDNAYDEGTDEQWQIATFDLYPSLLKQIGVWPTIGNHEMGAAKLTIPGRGEIFAGGISISSDPYSYMSTDDPTPRIMPYLDIFSLPSKAESGGKASNTELYYSFDYGNVHVISLDSQLSIRDDRKRQAMKNWLVADLNNNNQDWTIVIFHHPPYTKGSHDSDKAIASRLGVDTPIISIREIFTPIFENFGVDLVYSGHSHSYERSYYLNNHRGDADEFDATKHTQFNADGNPALGSEVDPFLKAQSSSPGYVVYSVNGSSGKAKLSGGSLDHPAHIIQTQDPEQRRGLLKLGSVVVDAGANELRSRFITHQGEVLDTVVIKRQ